MTAKIVVSHATADKPIVEAFVEYLRLTLDLKRNDIYCTSISGTIPTGVKFVEHIKDHIEGAQIVPLLLTENYFKSRFCLAELGAVWMINKNIYPILMPPLNFDVLDSTPLAGMQAKRISSPDDLIGIADEFYNMGIMETAPIVTLISQKAREFFGNIDGIMAQIKTKEEQTVSQEEYEKLNQDNEMLLK
ncbi:toll/interleukin-1 receptor domain-containing protein [Peribacillus sp. NPDC101480]|uniref:toll/interleukin-1 receptor domain-containing protein n=1 Tax=Peribacillus sp. NPDC101480 TaxID=3390620 RepID=UPI003D00D5F9